ncbi:MAG: VOC family protein [Geminicoccaceae bacterium]|nr:VOC family protein [Geminicoccaceae bacterium]
MPSISHVTLGSNDPVRAGGFYDAVLGALGWSRLPKPAGKPPAYRKGASGPVIYVQHPFDGQPATVGNGSHLALVAETREMVRAFHQQALAQGGSDEGEPGLRPHYADNYYAAYVRDIDGNKLQAVCYAEDA